MNSVLATIAPAMDALHEHVLPGAQGGQRDDQLSEISQRGVQEPTGRVARLGRNGFSGVTQQCG
jgi:hypothetical protein